MLQAERDKIEADRAETQKMMQELLKLKAEMQGDQSIEGENNSADSENTGTEG